MNHRKMNLIAQFDDGQGFLQALIRVVRFANPQGDKRLFGEENLRKTRPLSKRKHEGEDRSIHFVSQPEGPVEELPDRDVIIPAGRFGIDMKPLLLFEDVLHALIGFFETTGRLDDREAAKSLEHRPLIRFEAILPNRELRNPEVTNGGHGDAVDWENVIGHGQKTVLKLAFVGFQNSSAFNFEVITKIDDEMAHHDSGQTSKEPPKFEKEGLGAINCFGFFLIVKAPTFLGRIDIAMLILRESLDRRKGDKRLIQGQIEIFLSRCPEL